MNKYSHRKAVISAIIICVCCIYIIRLFYMQVIDNSFQEEAIRNSQRITVQYPARGLIFDRNGKLLVENQPAYDLMVIPLQVKQFDTTELITILNIDKDILDKSLKKCYRYSPYKASILISQITADKYAILQEKLYKYPGFFMQTRTLRKYNVNHSADVFGYIGEVNQSQIDRDSTYAPGDYIGINGLEKSYEDVLRGKKGEKIMLVDNYNRIKGSYKNGEYDKPAIVGGNITTTLDIDLQEYAYHLMRNKKGGIIAIEPQTGEILLKVSSPGYNPQLMIGLERGRNYKKLYEDPNLPLFDRTISATYPPGSIFKTVVGLIGLEEGAIVPETRYECHHGNYFNGQLMKCHGHESPVDLKGGIKNSCNPYFVNVFRRTLESNRYANVREAYGKWREYVMSFGVGQKLCPDFYNEKTGDIPTQQAYDKQFRTQSWYYTYFRSLAIGQGELVLTPMQMANIVTSIANRGHYITPHIVRRSEEEYIQLNKHEIPIQKKHFNVIIDAMEEAVKSGTGRIAAVDSVSVCGKTGTIQNPHGKDHSAFFAFAPKENPKIAILVYVENGIWGATYAAPIAGLLMDKYLNGKIPERKKALETRMLEADLIHAPAERNAHGLAAPTEDED